MLLFIIYIEFDNFNQSDNLYICTISVPVIIFHIHFQNPYESFMRKHLQHYGYYTGKCREVRATEPYIHDNKGLKKANVSGPFKLVPPKLCCFIFISIHVV